MQRYHYSLHYFAAPTAGRDIAGSEQGQHPLQNTVVLMEASVNHRLLVQWIGQADTERLTGGVGSMSGMSILVAGGSGKACSTAATLTCKGSWCTCTAAVVAVSKITQHGIVTWTT